MEKKKCKVHQENKKFLMGGSERMGENFWWFILLSGLTLLAIVHVV